MKIKMRMKEKRFCFFANPQERKAESRPTFGTLPFARHTSQRFAKVKEQNLTTHELNSNQININPLNLNGMKKFFTSFILFSLIGLSSVFAQVIMDELNGSTLGTPTGITYTATTNGQGAVFSRTAESRIEYPFSMGLPHQGTIEMLIKVTNGYSYNNYTLVDNQENAHIFTTGPSDVWYLGAMWLNVNNNGNIALTTALSSTPTSHILTATGTAFRFNEWHVVSFSYGSQGQYLKVNGQLVASDSSYTETLQACGDWGSNRVKPTVGEFLSVFWNNNQYEHGFEGTLDCFRASSTQQDWVLTSLISSIKVSENNKTIKVYPNPVSNELIIEIEGNNRKVNFDILNTIGQVVFKGNLVDKTTVQTSNLIHGIYLIKLENGRTFEFKKIIKE
jgi:hypothetical protein